MNPFQTPRLLHFPGKRLSGLSLEMSFAEDRTSELWRAFRARLQELPEAWTASLYNVQDYPVPPNHPDFSAQTRFVKRALLEAPADGSIPDGWESYELPAGLYAVFRHRGPASAFPATARFIYGEWLPASGYAVENRPFFECFGRDYKPLDPDVEEAVWIPVRPQE